MRILAGLLSLATGCVPAAAQTCADSFETEGDPRNGLLFTAQVHLPGLTARSALGQLQLFAVDGGYEAGGELLVGDSGEFSFVQAGSRPPLTIRAVADAAGRVSLGLKLARGQQAGTEDVKSEFCSLLGRLKTGAEGDALAESGRAKSGSARIIDVDAVKLSAALDREMEKVLAPVAAKGKLGRLVIGAGTSAAPGEYAEAFAPVRAKHLGRRYRIDGQIYTISQDLLTREMTMSFLVTPTRGLLGIRQEDSFNNLNFAIRCNFAADQARFFATLGERNHVTLTGVVTDLVPGVMQLSECRKGN
jgi:hypothetical protein